MQGPRMVEMRGLAKEREAWEDTISKSGVSGHHNKATEGVGRQSLRNN